MPVKTVARSVAQLIFGNEGLSKRLEKMAWAQRLAKFLRLRQFLNAGLSLYPIKKVLPVSGVILWAETFETLAVEREYFGNPIYTEIFSAYPPTTFIDLGCNSGVFPCFLAHVKKRGELRGLCVDAVASQVELTKRSLARNDWKEIHVLQGMVGCVKSESKEAEFYLAPTSLGSSQFAYSGTESGYPLDWKKTVVPTLEVGATWTRLFGVEQRCHCLKIDIEGSEIAFLENESRFLERVDSILLEWHIWATTRDGVVSWLASKGFTLDKVIEDEPRHGVLYFRRAHR